jgi:hypothetical protein
MKTILLVLLTIWGAFLPKLIYAQSATGKISGQVLDAASKPVDGATVTLLSAKDSSLIKTELASTDGSFLFEKIKDGDYKIQVTTVGFKNYRSGAFSINPQNPAVTLAPIPLQQSGTELKGVSITSQKSFIEHKIDRTVVNVDALISNAGTTALDVLEKSPGVLVDQNGAVSLKGKGVTIFVDDKPTYLSGADLEGYLRSLPSSALDQIELMPNPPAKYDAAGNGGVINIRTKKNKLRGFNGTLNLSYAQGIYGKTNNSLNFNYRNNRFNFFGTLSYNTQNNFSNLDINRHYFNPDGSTSSYFIQNTFIRRTGDAYNSKIGMDFYQDDKTTWGVVLNGMFRPSQNNNLNTSNLLNANNQLDSTIVAHNQQHNHFKNGGINLNYRHQYDKSGHELTADLDYIAYQTNSNQLFDNYGYLPDGSLESHDLLSGMLPSHINIYAAKVDYTLPLRDGFKFAAGIKSSFTQTDNEANYYDTVNDTTRPDYGKTNHFLYKENINAAYINLNKDYKRLSIQAGLRFENTYSNGHQLGNPIIPDSSFKRNYNSLFPTLYLSYKLDSASVNQFGLNYGRRIDRPYYQDLNPFISPLDKFTYYVGNPFLKPSFTNNIELSHTYKNRITTTLSYSKTNNDVNETIEIVNGIYYSRPGNIGSSEVKSASVDATFDPAKWLNFHFYGEVTNIHSVSAFYTGTLDTKGTFFVIRPMLQFTLSKSWNTQIDYLYQSKITNAQFVLGTRNRLNFGVSKKLSPSTTVKLTMNDIFYTYINTGVINNLANTTANWRNAGDTRFGVLSLSYRFGKTIADQRKHDANGAESEQNRVKN